MFSKQEGDKSKPSNSRQWSSRYRNPRIVRVSSTFGGKDRHSKVRTVRGLRDRRIRLSAPTAIQLYDLEDKLDLGQPSKVIDWLLNLAKDDIDKLPPLPFPLGFDHLLLNPQETSNFPTNYNQLSLVPFLDRDCEYKEKRKWVMESDGQSSSSPISAFSSHNSPSSSLLGFSNIGSAMAFNQRNLQFGPPSLSLYQNGNSTHTHHSSQKAKWVIASDGHSSSSSSSFLAFSSHNNPSSSSPSFPNIGSTMAFNQPNFHFGPPSLSLSQIGTHTHHFSQNEISLNNGNSKNHQIQPLSQLIFYPQASMVPPSIPFQPFPPREELEDSSRKTFQ